MWEKALLIKLILIWRQNQFILFKNKKLNGYTAKSVFATPVFLVTQLYSSKAARLTNFIFILLEEFWALQANAH